MQLTILRDTREKRPWSFEGFPVQTVDATLSTGDYTFAECCRHDTRLDTFHPRFAVERKTGTDFLTAITWDRSRFEAELQRVAEWPTPLPVVVEESWTTFLTNRGSMRWRDIYPSQVVGTVSAWTVAYNVEFIFAGSRSSAQLCAFSRLCSRGFLRQEDDSYRMPFSVSWHTLLDELDDLPEGATLITPHSHERFRLTDVQEHRVVVTFIERDETQPLQREQFETLYRRITEESGSFELDRLPPDADPYPAVLSLHPRFEIDEDAGVIVETEAPTTTQLLDADVETTDEMRTEPDLDVYADALLLVDALERYDVTALDDLGTDALVNLYTMLSDTQRNANALRKDVGEMLLGRLHHDRPLSGPYGSVQRTMRRNRRLKDDDEVLRVLSEAGIDAEQVMSVDRKKVDDALDVTDVRESEVYEVDESEYVRKADVDEDIKQTRLQGLKDQLATTGSEEAQELREEIDTLEDRIDELTSFRTGREFNRS